MAEKIMFAPSAVASSVCSCVVAVAFRICHFVVTARKLRFHAEKNEAAKPSQNIQRFLVAQAVNITSAGTPSDSHQ